MTDTIPSSRLPSQPSPYGGPAPVVVRPRRSRRLGLAVGAGVIAALVAALVVSAVSTQQHLVDERVHVAALSDDLTAAKADLNSTSAELVQAQDRETETVSNLVTCRSLGPVSTHLLAALKSMIQARLDRVDGAHDTHGGPIDDSKAELDAATKATSDAGYDALPELVDACKGTGTGSGA